MRLLPGENAPLLDVRTLHGERLRLPAPDVRIVHLQFRRFAGCPICNLHLRAVTRRIHELEAAGIREVAFFHSTDESMRPFQGDLPFDVVADPEKKHYRSFGVETSVRALSPRSWLSGLRGAVAGHPSNPLAGEGSRLGLPADFLLAPNGIILALKYGSHADDQWSVDEVLAIAREQRPGEAFEGDARSFIAAEPT